MASTSRSSREWAYVWAECGLCQLKLEPGDDIEAVKKQSTISSQSRLDPAASRDALTSSESRPRYRVWSLGAGSPVGTGYHAECLAIIGFASSFVKVREVTFYDFEPKRFLARRREAWIQSKLALALAQEYPRLPLELCHRVGRYCTREYAVTYAQSLTAQVPKFWRVDLSRKVWARYVDFEGVRYVASLTNDKSEELVFDPETGSRVQTVYIGKDHLGIRRLVFVETFKAPAIDECPGVWWVALPVPHLLPPSNAVLRGESDGIKLRNLRTTSGLNSPIQALWAIPRVYMGADEVRPLARDSYMRPYTMASVPCNHPDITGYSFLWDRGLVTIHAHTHGENMSLSKTIVENHGDGIWFYLPINEGELITHAWTRSAFRPRDSALLIKTSQDRVILVGAYKKSWEPTRWGFLHQLNGSPERLFFDENPRRSRAVAFESRCLYNGIPSIHIERNISALPNPRSTAPRFDTKEECCFTSASLDGVTKVTPCRCSPINGSSINGLLFEYTTGRRACVGQIRTDSLDRPLAVCQGEKMWLGIEKSSTNCTNVVTCDVDVAPPSRKDLTFLEVTWEGTLEWWFSANQSRVYHCR